MFTGWWELFRLRFTSHREFVSLDAKQHTPGPLNYELKKVALGPIGSPRSGVTSPGPGLDAYRPALTGTPDHFSREAQREYRSPDLSFSAPRAPSQAAMRVAWDPRSTHARGGLGLHPPLSDDEDEEWKENKI